MSGISKAVNPILMMEVLKSVPVFPEIFILPTITLFPVLEIVIAVFLIMKYRELTSLVICNGLFLFFLIFSIYGVVIGIDKEFGSLIKSHFDWKMILRNLIFYGLSTYLTVSYYISQKDNYRSRGRRV